MVTRYRMLTKVLLMYHYACCRIALHCLISCSFYWFESNIMYIYGHHVMYDIRIMSYMTCGVQYALKFFVLVCQLLSLFISDEDFSFKKHHDIVEAKRSNMNFTNSAKNKCLCSYWTWTVFYYFFHEEKWC